MLQSREHPLSVIFDSELINEFYKEANNSSRCFDELDRFLDLYAHKKPDMNVLEIGAGTGETTHRVLSTIGASATGSEDNVRRYSKYDFTDASPAFFEKAY